MLKINKSYRKFYTGENIVVERHYISGVWHDTTENVPNAVINEQISNQAVVIGNGPSRLEFDLRLIKNHKGGLYGSRTLQTYGCNALYRDFEPDFLVAVGNTGIINEIVNSNYHKDHIVYAHAPVMLDHPGIFYLIPNDPYTDAGTTAAYLAAFDGHKNIYMLGFDLQDTANYNYNVYAGTANYDSLHTTVLDVKWRLDFAEIARTYNEVNFSFVYPYSNHPLPIEWTTLPNVRSINYRTFVLETDL